MAKNRILVLLTDDDDKDRQILKEALLPLTEQITEAKSGLETLRYLVEQDFDCLVLDHKLPDFKGVDLVREIRSRGISTSIVVITDRDEATLAVQMIRAGAQDYLPKTKVTTDMISKAVLNAIRLKQTMDETEYYKDFYDTAPVGFYTTCIKTGRFIKANQFLVNLLGCDSFAELKDNYKVHDFYSRTRRRQLLAAVKKGDKVTDFEIEITAATGNKRWAILTARPCKNGDCLEGSVTDITERRLMSLEIERLKQREINKLKAIGDQARAKLKEVL